MKQLSCSSNTQEAIPSMMAHYLTLGPNTPTQDKTGRNEQLSNTKAYRTREAAKIQSHCQPILAAKPTCWLHRPCLAQLHQFRAV